MALYPNEIPDIAALKKRVITPVDWTFLMDEVAALFAILGINPQGRKATVADRIGSEGSIDTIDLADGAVTTPKLADLAVTTPKLADGAVTSGKLGAGAVTGTRIAAGTITGGNIAAGTITSANVQDGSLTGADLAPGTLTADRLPAGGTVWSLAQHQRTDLVGQTGSNVLTDYLLTTVTPRAAAAPIRIAYTLMGTLVAPSVAGQDLLWRVRLKVDGVAVTEIQRFTQGTGQQLPWTVAFEQWVTLSAVPHTIAIDVYQPGPLYTLNTLSAGSLICQVPT